MFFIAYVLCCLRLLELRTEGQTKKQKSLPKSLPKKLESTFSLILVNFKVLQGTGSRSLIISIENAQAVIIFGFELQIVPHYADLLSPSIDGESKTKIHLQVCNFSPSYVLQFYKNHFQRKVDLTKLDSDCSYER